VVRKWARDGGRERRAVRERPATSNDSELASGSRPLYSLFLRNAKRGKIVPLEGASNEEIAPSFTIQLAIAKTLAAAGTTGDTETVEATSVEEAEAAQELVEKSAMRIDPALLQIVADRRRQAREQDAELLQSFGKVNKGYKRLRLSDASLMPTSTPTPTSTSTPNRRNSNRQVYLALPDETTKLTVPSAPETAQWRIQLLHRLVVPSALNLRPEDPQYMASFPPELMAQHPELLTHFRDSDSQMSGASVAPKWALLREKLWNNEALLHALNEVESQVDVEERKSPYLWSLPDYETTKSLAASAFKDLVKDHPPQIAAQLASDLAYGALLAILEQRRKTLRGVKDDESSDPLLPYRIGSTTVSKAEAECRGVIKAPLDRGYFCAVCLLKWVSGQQYNKLGSALLTSSSAPSSRPELFKTLGGLREHLSAHAQGLDHERLSKLTTNDPEFAKLARIFSARLMGSRSVTASDIFNLCQNVNRHSTGDGDNAMQVGDSKLFEDKDALTTSNNVRKSKDGILDDLGEVALSDDEDELFRSFIAKADRAITTQAAALNRVHHANEPLNVQEGIAFPLEILLLRPNMLRLTDDAVKSVMAEMAQRTGVDPSNVEQAAAIVAAWHQDASPAEEEHSIKEVMNYFGIWKESFEVHPVDTALLTTSRVNAFADAWRNTPVSQQREHARPFFNPSWVLQRTSGTGGQTEASSTSSSDMTASQTTRIGIERNHRELAAQIVRYPPASPVPLVPPAPPAPSPVLERVPSRLASERPMPPVESESKPGPSGRVRRKRAELIRNHACLVEGCGLLYATTTALRTHMKLKHPEIPLPPASRRGRAARQAPSPTPSPSDGVLGQSPMEPGSTSYYEGEAYDDEATEDDELGEDSGHEAD